VILEEAAFMDPSTFFQVVVPLIGVKNTALVAITTPQDEGNYFSELMVLKDQHGQRLFHCIELGLMCERCKREKLACQHKLHMSPSV
jgi:hypothetical protein